MKKRTIGILLVVFLLAAGAASVYIGIGMHYQTHFFEHTTINGMDVSDLTASEAEALVAQQAEDYRVTITTREEAQETIEGTDIGYRYVSTGEVQELLDDQSFLNWLPSFLGEESNYHMETSTVYDEEKLAQAAEQLSCMQSDQVTPPADAYVSRQEDGTFVVVPETEGDQLDADKTFSLLKDAVENSSRAVNLELSECYVEPAIRSDNFNLQAEAAMRNRYSQITVTYAMGGDVTVTLDPETVYSWFSVTEENQPAIDREAVAAWVNALADQYDTIGAYLPFVTSNGETVYPESRTYGWQMDRESETEALYQQLLSGDSAQRSPIWYESAGTRGQNDIGNTYVEIDYTNQRMWYYKDGVLLVETPVVTGNVSAGNASPEGVFCIVGKEENATLVGEDYQTPVSYWMPFYGGVGIHDADTWRTSYGGDIYQYSGSHGCINTPTAQAAVIFQNITEGTPVVCYSSGVNYGYSQQSSGSTVDNSNTAGTDSDIVIIDGDSTGTAENAEENGADGSLYNQDSNQADFPITTTDEWSGQASDAQVQIIY
jgi:lipoprotein-anchoring transpeptidase ErfK/SrfK